jgi:hypothetical protein
MSWKERIPEFVIGSVIIGGGSWLLLQTYGINRAMGSLEAKVDAKLSENSGRIDRIAAVLPDVRIKIAKEELSKPIATAVVVLDPSKTVKGKWVTTVHVIDAAAKTRSTYSVGVKGPQDKEVAWLTSGAAVDADPEAVSFKMLAAFSSDTGEPASAPAYVLTQNSYALRKSSADFNRALSEILKSKGTTVHVETMNASTNSWPRLTEELTKNPNKYMVVVPEK